jgi:hypothetical protein
MSGRRHGWAESPIGSLCNLNNGRAFKPTEWTMEGLPIVRIQNLNNPDAPYNRFNGEFDDRYHLRGGELLFAWSGTPGTSFGAHMWRGGEAVLNQHIFRVDFDETSLDKRYFRYAINEKLEELISIAHGGVGLRHVTKGKFEKTLIAVPPLDEQKRIADTLDAALARVDACRERLDRIPDILKRFREAVLAFAISGELTKDWRSSRAILETGKALVDQVRAQYKRFAAENGAAKEKDAIRVRAEEISEEELRAFFSDDLPEGWSVVRAAEVVQPGAEIVYGIVQPGPKLDEGVPR